MTTQQTDVEKTLKRILARRFVHWPIEDAVAILDTNGSPTFFTGAIAHILLNCGGNFERVTQAEWEAERALLASEQSQPLGDSEEFDQALWDKVAVALAPAVYAECCKGMDATGYPENWREGVAKDWALTVDAFMAERAKRIAARKASHD